MSWSVFDSVGRRTTIPQLAVRAFPAVALLGALAAVSPIEAAWTTPANVPTGASGNAVDARVGLACNGDAAVSWKSSNSVVWVATRRAGNWDSQGFGTGNSPELEMNSRGDLVLAWRKSSSTFCAAFRRAGGAWETERCFPGSFGSYRPSIALNEAGAAIVAWIDDPAGFSDDAVASVRTASATSWPDAETAATDITYSSNYIAVASALDQSGNAIVGWMDTYGLYNTTAGITGGLSGVRTRSRSAAGAWGAVSAVTSRPPVDPFSPGAVPNFTTPTLAADPASGALIATFPGSTDYLMLDALGNGDDWTPDYSSNRAWVALGSVTGGLGAPSEHGGGRIGLIEAAGAPGRFALAGYLGSPIPNGSGADAVAGVNSSGSAPVLNTLGPPVFSGVTLAQAVDVGPTGTAAAMLNGEVWVAHNGGGFAGPDNPLPTREVSDVAVNCIGEIFAAGATAGSVDEEVRFTEELSARVFEDGFESGLGPWSAVVP